MKRRTVAILGLLFLTSLISSGLFWLHDHYEVSSTAQAGRPMPRLSLFDLNGLPVDFDEYHGNHVLAVFIESDCAYCDATYSFLREVGMDSTYDVSIVAITKSPPPKLSNPGNPELPIWIDSDEQLRRRLGVFTVPAVFHIDKDGILRHQFVGAGALERARDIIEGS